MSDKPRGRPPLDAEPATTVIKVRVTAAQRLELRRVADENGTGLSGVIREAVSEYVADYRERSSFQQGHTIRRTLHTTDMANTPTPQPPSPQPQQPPQPSGPSQPPNTPSTGTHLPKP